MVVCTDRGSDNFAGIHALMYKKSVKLNVSPWWDGSHDAWRSVLESIRENGLMPFTIMVMIVCNLAHGPGGTDMRYAQVKAAAESLFKVHTSQTCTLFSFYVRDLAKELVNAASSEGSMGSVQSVWEELKNFSLFRAKGYKANFNRFQSVVREGRSLLSRWFCSLLVAEYTALESGMLHNTALRAKLRLRGASTDDGADTGSTAATSVDTRSIRSCSQNAVVVSVLTLQDRRHFRMLNIIVVSSQPVEFWHGIQNTETRDVKRGSKWAIAQVTGDYMRHVSEVVMMPGTEAAALSLGFGAPLGEAGRYQWGLEGTMAEADFAQLFGSLCMVSWPWSMLRILNPAQDGERIVGQFKADFEAFEALQAVRAPTKDMSILACRSHFNMLATDQLVQICQRNQWRVSEDLMTVMMQRSLTIFGSQITEDTHNVQKNDKSMAGYTSSGQQHFRRPETSYAAAISRGVVDRVHRFERPVLRTALVRRSVALEQSFFKPSHSSLPFQSIASTTQKADYWSLAPASAAAPVGDHELLRAAAAGRGLASIADSWLGAWCDAKNQIIFKTQADDQQWYYGMTYLDRSSCVAWPVDIDTESLKDGHQVINFLPADRPHLFPILSLEGLVGFTFAWKSWAWQRPNLRHTLTVGVRAVKLYATPVEALEHLLARNAWFDLPKAIVLDFNEHLNHPKPQGDSLSDVVFAATKNVLQISDSDCMGIMTVRFARLPCHTEYMADLLEVDEAQNCLDENDRKELQNAQLRHQENIVECKAFVKRFQGQRSRMTSSPQRGTAKKQKNSAMPQYQGPKRLPEPGRESISQKDLRVYLPPGAYIWVSRGVSAWCTRIPPMKQCTCTWRGAGGEDLVANAALADVWRECLEMQGLPLSECPIAGLLEPAVAAASSSSAA